jgi:hypothetical protein
VASIVGVTDRRIAQLEAEGVLHATIDERGVHRFRREEVTAYAIRRTNRKAATRDQRHDGHAEIAAQVFELFRQGVELPDIVIMMKLSPSVIRELYSEYTLPLGAVGSRKSAATLRAEVKVRSRLRELDEEDDQGHGARRR